MDDINRNQLHRWWVPLASIVVFFGILAFTLPYATSLWENKRTLAGLVFAMCQWGQGSIDSSYCLFVPPIVIYLIWARADELKAAPIKSDNWGMAVILVGLFSFWFGMRAQNQYFGFLALQILMSGVVLWLWGRPVFRILLFPWAFFLFGWPMPFLDPIIAFPLRMTMSTMAAHLLPVIGIPTVQSGTALLSPADPLHSIALGSRFQIDIADPCSGIRSLFALLMFSALFGYLFLPKMWQQWVIFLSAFPLAILGNLARVIMLVLASIVFGSKFAIGTGDDPSWFHESCGFLVYAVALGAEFGIANLLTKKWNSPVETPDAEQAPA